MIGNCYIFDWDFAYYVFSYYYFAYWDVENLLSSFNSSLPCSLIREEKKDLRIYRNIEYYNLIGIIKKRCNLDILLIPYNK